MNSAYIPTFEATSSWFEQTFDTTVECGYLIVPENRVDPGGRTIRLAVAILRPADGAPEPDPIVHLAGGPGEKILHFMAEEYDNFARYLAINREVIIVEQRGVGWGRPVLDCPDYTAAFLDLLDFDIGGRSVTARQAGEYTVEVLQRCAEQLRSIAHLPAYNTRENAADVNDLRRVLGYDRLNLHAISYGTEVALNIMGYFPETVRSVVLDAVRPLDRPLDRFPRNTVQAVETLFAACATDDACRAAFPNLHQIYYDTLKRLDDNPVPLVVINEANDEPYVVLLNSTTFAFAISQMIRQTSRLPALPMVVHMAGQGDYTFIEKFYGFFPLKLAGLSIGMHFSVHGREKTLPGSMEAYELSLTELPIGSDYWDFHPAGRPFFLLAGRWGSGMADKADMVPVVSDIPTLILGGQFDPNAEPDDMNAVAATLPNSYIYLMPWMGHSVSSHDCANRMIRLFITDPTQAPDSSCIEQWKAQFQFLVPSAVGEA